MGSPPPPAATFTVDPRYLQRTTAWVWAALGVGVLLLVVAFVDAFALHHNGGLFLLFGLVLLAGGGLLLLGARRTRGTTYALSVDPVQLRVTWRDISTVIPVAAVDHALLASNGPWYRAVDVQLRPGAAVSLPEAARPRPSKLHPGYVELFIVAMLKEQEAACLQALARVVPLRDGPAGP